MYKLQDSCTKSSIARSLTTRGVMSSKIALILHFKSFQRRTKSNSNAAHLYKILKFLGPITRDSLEISFFEWFTRVGSSTNVELNGMSIIRASSLSFTRSRFKSGSVLHSNEKRID